MVLKYSDRQATEGGKCMVGKRKGGNGGGGREGEHGGRGGEGIASRQGKEERM